MPQGEAYELLCEVCEASFTGKAEARFCSNYCRNQAYRERKHPPSRVCPACGTVFAWNGRQRFCSRFCREVFQGKRRIGPQGGVIVCTVCGKRRAVYIPSVSKVCGDCLPEWQARATRAWEEANPERVRELDRRRKQTPEYRAYMAAYKRRRRAEPNPPVYMQWRKSPRECARCGEPTIKRRRLCEECRRPLPVLSTVAYGRARIAITPPQARLFVMGWCLNDCEPYVMAPGKFRPGTKYCSPECGREYDRYKREGAIGLIAVLVRYDFICHLCLQPIDITVDPQAPRAATRDHVIPLSKGGLDVIENLRPAHRDCNTWKGAKSVEEYLEPPADVDFL